MPLKTIFCLILIPLFSSIAHSQIPEAVSPSNSQRPQRPRLGQIEEEMFRRAEIRHAEESHKRLVERAKQAAQLGFELQSSFEKSGALAVDDYKTLERIEELARKIRSGFGGSDDDQELDENPSDMSHAVKLLAEIAEQVDEEVSKTTRHVVSGTVIERSNQIIELVRLIRGMNRR